MSTKIYNGYEIDIPNLSLRQAQALVMPTMNKIRAKAKQMTVDWLAAETLLAIDLPLAKGLPWPEGPLSKAHGELMDRQARVRRTQERDPSVDFSFDVCFVPLGRRTLALAYTDQRSFTRIWERTPHVWCYPYWDNTDQPQGVSARDWDKRGRDWDNALEPGGNHFVPGQVGFAIDAFGAYNTPMPTKEEVLARMNRAPFEGRALGAARAILREAETGPKLSALEEKRKEETEDRHAPSADELKDLDWAEISRILRAWEDWAKTDEGKKKIADKTDEVKKVLKRKFVAEDLVGKFGVGVKK